MATTLNQHAYEYIRHALESGGLTAGSRVSATALAGEIGISKTPVREAINRLTTEGLLLRVPQKGAFVKVADRQELVDLIELRALLECNAAAQAARRIRPAELDELEGHVSNLRRWIDEHLRYVSQGGPIVPRFNPKMPNLAFHMTILRAAGNRQVIQIIEQTEVMTRMFGHRTDAPSAREDRVGSAEANYKVHEDVYEAIRRRDADGAWQAMAAHMDRARKNILARFDWLHAPHEPDEALERDFPESVRELIRKEVQRIETRKSTEAEEK